jgi:tRNA (uracil-5-)-methyltransferase TRM9
VFLLWLRQVRPSVCVDEEMEPATRTRLLDLNRQFYAQVGGEFDKSRSGLPSGWVLLRPFLPRSLAGCPCHVLDAGCGNGRFARFLEMQAQPWLYVGIDADATLLALAAEHCAKLAHVQASFQQLDLTSAGWSRQLAESDEKFDLIVCFAMLHHVPSLALRTQLLRELATLLAPNGLMILSNWQFLDSERFQQKIVPWMSIGIDPADVEPGDALLPWSQGGQALRYVHQVSAPEVATMAQAAGLTVVHSFYADGKEGRLNLYSLLRLVRT